MIARSRAFHQPRRLVLVGDFLGYCSDVFRTRYGLNRSPIGILDKNVPSAACNSPFDHLACADPI